MLKSIAVATLCVLGWGVVVPAPSLAQYFQVPAPYPNGAGPGFGGGMPAVVYGQRCQSPVGLCMMGSPGPVRTSCYCMTPYGPAQGVIVL
jgi:hypothetical protein